MGYDLNVVRIDAHGEAAGVIAMLACMADLASDGVRCKAVRPDRHPLHPEGAIPFPVTLATRPRPLPIPTTVGESVHMAHESFDVFLVKVHGCAG